MATVTGNALDITGATMDLKDIRVVFTLNAVNVGMNEGGLIPDNQTRVKPHPDTGEFSLNLQPTTSMALDAWYDVSLTWKQDVKPLTGYLGIKIRVPGSGGRINDLIDTSGSGGGPNRRIVWVGLTPPANPYPFMLWLEQEPGPNPDPFDPRNTSDLHEWRP